MPVKYKARQKAGFSVGTLTTSYIKDTNHFSNKIKSIGKLPGGALIYTMDVVGLYANIPRGQGLTCHFKFLGISKNK